MLDGFFNWPKNVVPQSVLVMATVNNYQMGMNHESLWLNPLYSVLHIIVLRCDKIEILPNPTNTTPEVDLHAQVAPAVAEVFAYLVLLVTILASFLCF